MSADEAARDTAVATVWMARFTFLLFVVTAGTLLILINQLREMHEGGIDTHALAKAAGNQATDTHSLAEQAVTQAAQTANLATAAKVQADSTRDLAEQARRSVESARQSIKDNRIASFREIRPYVQITKLDFLGDVFKGETLKGKASILNSGRTPAVDVRGCADIAVRPNGEPMQANFPCPAPNNPKGNDIGEHSQFALGSGAAGFSVDSPGTTIAPSNVSAELFRRMVSSGALRIYFYGYIEYGDLNDSETVHHTTFCGRYNPESGMLDICEKHNRMD